MWYRTATKGMEDTKTTIKGLEDTSMKKKQPSRAKSTNANSGPTTSSQSNQRDQGKKRSAEDDGAGKGSVKRSRLMRMVRKLRTATMESTLTADF